MAVSFLKRGKAARAAHARADAEAEVRATQNKYHRFWLPKDTDKVITFLDGRLNKEGMLDVPSYDEHRVNINGSWKNFFPCTADEEPCPLCQQDNYPTLVTVFTVLDHSKWKDRNGKTHRHERKLFVAKRDTVKLLQKMATKRGGLAGWRVSVSRVGERSPEVGTAFDFLDQYDIKELAAALKLKPEDVQPFDYEEAIPYLSADELREAGFGAHVVGQHDTKTLRKKSKVAAVEDDDEDDDDLPPPKIKAKKTAKPVIDDEDDDFPPASKAKGKAKPADDEDDEDDDFPPAKSKGKGKTKVKPVEDDEDDDAGESDEDDLPPPKKTAKKVKKPAVVDVDDDEDEDEDDDM